MFLKTYHPFKDTLTKSNSTHSLQLVTYSKTFGSNGKKNQVHIRSMLFLMFLQTRLSTFLTIHQPMRQGSNFTLPNCLGWVVAIPWYYFLWPWGSQNTINLDFSKKKFKTLSHSKNIMGRPFDCVT